MSGLRRLAKNTCLPRRGHARNRRAKDQEVENRKERSAKQNNPKRTRRTRERLSEDSGCFWIKFEGEKRLATENLAVGIQAYKEKLVTYKKREYRIWDPYRSKLASAILNGVPVHSLCYGASVLYLGASTGTTVSHVSDMVGSGGAVFAVEHTSRVARELMERVARHRPNVTPILQDARRPSEYFSVFGRMDVVYCDIAQPDQTEISINNCKKYLKPGGTLFLVIKARSINVAKNPGDIFRSEISKLQDFDVLHNVDLRPYHKDHAMVLGRYCHHETNL
ncbi:MAG: fibrillarin-like rRNA/tRNA 2'-O-methyltransferase [Cenarchaeum sp. SB0665_bin_23]|nr:fibrillarin-like rRNA/tRNA 2'-O-methyltransferase [Cenarchaeum sp. SB0665_bin_23]MYB47354.1 fibrillarin-like rRNA/tRNA 2'-O-methyltransferase [Cenarchaeum sp. SB0662_bin_33]MYG33648.1 fibrillarin-like rRNA/tRNA 2'-O-methyltransferase [Cenarchaeum sp. SB0677_bin_16]